MNKIRAIRLRRGMTQRQVGFAAGLDPSYVSTLECSDAVTPRVDTLMRLAKALRCGIDDLVPERLRRSARLPGSSAC